MSYMPASKSDTHVTPDRVFDLIYEKWGWLKPQMFDPCPVDVGWKHSIFHNGLYMDWKPRNFVNPPYTYLKEFVWKAVHEKTFNGFKTIMLLPAKTDQEWFHNYVKHRDIEWISKRLHFKNNRWSATQPHFLVMIE